MSPVVKFWERAGSNSDELNVAKEKPAILSKARRPKGFAKTNSTEQSIECRRFTLSYLQPSLGVYSILQLIAVSVMQPSDAASKFLFNRNREHFRPREHDSKKGKDTLPASLAKLKENMWLGPFCSKREETYFALRILINLYFSCVAFTPTGNENKLGVSTF